MKVLIPKQKATYNLTQKLLWQLKKAALSFSPQAILKNIRIHLIFYLCSDKDLGLMFHVNIVTMTRPGAQSMVWFLFSSWFSALQPKIAHLPIFKNCYKEFWASTRYVLIWQNLSYLHSKWKRVCILYV